MKSHVSILVELAACVYKDAAAKCTVDKPDMLRDLETIRSRVKHEGLSFITITLPTFGSDLETCLALGYIDTNLFRAFRRPKRQAIPAFLRGMLCHVFDSGTGRIFDETDNLISAIEGLRQIAATFKKVGLACSKNRTRQAFTKFIKTEQDLRRSLRRSDIATFSSVSRLLWGSVLAGKEAMLLTEGRPKHGPGATAERISGNSKYVHKRWHDRLEPYFPLFHNAFSSENAYWSEEFEKVSIVKEADEQPVRVIAVPKTLKTPRIIAIEPVCMQYAQQSISKQLIQLLESHKFTSGQINFRCQETNRDLAIKASKTGKFATLDMSEASDRVPCSLALSMFDCVPEIRNAIWACRSRSAHLPGEYFSTSKNGIKPKPKRIPLRKFASMGSALCFPVEAMYFYTICVKALLVEQNLPTTWHNLRKVCRQVYVYGDDIIVPTHYAEAVMETLQEYYCKVNVAKSFWTGRFRESCGMDAYAGEEVTPTYVRQMPPHHRKSTAALISWVKTSNLFYRRGYWQTASYMKDHVEALLGKLPIIGEKCGGLGWESYQGSVTAERWNTDYQVMEVKTWVPETVYQTDGLNGYPALTKCLLLLEEAPKSPFHSNFPKERSSLSYLMRGGKIDDGFRAAEDEGLQRTQHLVKTSRFGVVAMKRRWVRPY